MRGFNKAPLTNNPGKASETTVLAGYIPVARFSLSTTETWRDNAGQLHTTTIGTLWRSLAQLAQAYPRRGSLGL